jgi:hypothetical protein
MNVNANVIPMLNRGRWGGWAMAHIIAVIPLPMIIAVMHNTAREDKA